MEFLKTAFLMMAMDEMDFKDIAQVAFTVVTIIYGYVGHIVCKCKKYGCRLEGCFKKEFESRNILLLRLSRNVLLYRLLGARPSYIECTVSLQASSISPLGPVSNTP